ncbi:Protein of unknown function [Bradyrhizobium brasilense]|uniref:DUF3307 domain-containing protein n=1 Tax=Bradyrhizobium brasilense TaxID=1419277 RepID=A0A1G6Z1C2_9BRAD|nr:DUF3307 domain-containing protein [Bradyrhizobium brasilense]SDD95616.1 Protein of unknown function [Bradyrhizobium brasilense]
MIDMFLWMLIGHAVADYPLQGDWLSKAKNPTFALVPGEVIWPMALLSHAAIHAGAVKLATGSWIAAAFEFVAHTAIDYAKCRGVIGYNQDQVAHVACKLAWASLFGAGVL